MLLLKLKVISVLSTLVIGMTWGLVLTSLANGWISDIETIFVLTFSAFSVAAGGLWGMVTTFSLFEHSECKGEQRGAYGGITGDNVKLCE